MAWYCSVSQRYVRFAFAHNGGDRHDHAVRCIQSAGESIHPPL
jgi:hypothetical protein